MSIGKLDNVLYVVRDLDEAIRFYRDALGLKVKLKAKNYAELVPDGGDGSVALLKRQYVYNVFEYQDLPEIGENGVTTFETDDIEEARRELDAKGVRILGDTFEDQYIRLFVFQDLYGNNLHVFERKRP
jgi:catechol 2,3-dioxygenase-like lactoylglutathione lyase family enzyme